MPGGNFISRLQDTKDESERNLLHEAASYAVAEDDARYFNALLDLDFSLYDEDVNGDLAAFSIAKIKSDGVFLEALSKLVEKGYEFGR